MDKPRIPLAQAEALGWELIELMQPAALRLELWGSIRRRVSTVGDIELGLIPVTEPAGEDLFGESSAERSLQLELVNSLVEQGVLLDRLNMNGVRARGPKFQRMLYMGTAPGPRHRESCIGGFPDGIPVDIFAVSHASWGVQKFIRTGPKDFSHAVVTPSSDGGRYLQPGMLVRDGRLIDGGNFVDTPEESDFLRAIGLAYVKPEDRH